MSDTPVPHLGAQAWLCDRHRLLASQVNRRFAFRRPATARGDGLPAGRPDFGAQLRGEAAPVAAGRAEKPRDNP